MKTPSAVIKTVCVVLVLLGIWILVACSSDGENYVNIPYKTESKVQYIKINDGFSHNGMYMDEGNNRIYCSEGRDPVVNLPQEADWDGRTTEPMIEFKIESVCWMGQDRFDQFLELFPLVPKDAPGG